MNNLKDVTAVSSAVPSDPACTVNTLRRLYVDTGFSVRQLSRTFGISRRQVREVLIVEGVSLRRVRRLVLSLDPAWWLAELDGGSVQELADRLQCSDMSIYRQLRRLGLPLGRAPQFEEWLAERTRGEGPCRRWTRTHTSSGLASAWYDGRQRLVHRLVWEHLCGPIAQGTDIVHVPTCTFRDCVLIDHLVPKAVPARIAESTANHAFAYGEQHWNAKLSEVQAHDILVSHATAAELASRYGVSQQTVSAIRAGRRWRHLAH